MGILNRLPETSIAGITFLQDASHPRGGVLIVTQQAAREIKDLPEGTVIIGGPVRPDNADVAVDLVGQAQMHGSVDTHAGGDLVNGEVGPGYFTTDWEAASRVSTHALLRGM
jgi:hypothetical protein